MESSPKERVQVVVADITTLPVDAIVTSTNESLSGWGGVDAAVHKAGGSGLRGDCLTIGYCAEGKARVTGGHLLPAKYVIHAVGPLWKGGSVGEAAILASCYQASLILAADHGLGTIAFPCIGTGTHGYPEGEACAVAVDTVSGWLRSHDRPRQVIFCCLTEESAALYRARLLSSQPSK